MPAPDTTTVLQHLLAATSACQVAFMDAARAVRSPAVAVRCVRRAAHHEQVRASLLEQATPGSASAVALPPPGRGDSDALRAARFCRAGDTDSLMRAGIRLLDRAIEDLGEAYSPAMPVAQRVLLDRHRGQMRWTRDELTALRSSSRPASRPASARADARQGPAIEEGVIPGNVTWFGLDVHTEG